MTDQRPYLDRREAGQILARRFSPVLRQVAKVVLGVARGGVPVAYELARAFDAPLDVLVVRRLEAPLQRELAIGAIASGGQEVLDQALIADLGIAPAQLADIRRREWAELHRREKRYRRERAAIELRGRVVILVDDGLVTGATMRVAIASVRQQDAARVIVAAPVGAQKACLAVAAAADEFVCPLQPDPFHAVGLWYDKFAPATDEDVQRCLTAATFDCRAGGSVRA